MTTVRDQTTAMTGLESVMWRVDDAALRPTIVVVQMLDTVPDWARLVGEHEWLSLAVPRLRQRVAGSPTGFGTPRWVDDPGFDMGHHLRRVRLPAPGDLRQLLDLAQAVERTPFDRDRPLWEAVLAEGLNGEHAGYVLKLHHSCMDGTSIYRMLSLILRHSPDDRGDRRVPLVVLPQRKDGWAPADLLQRPAAALRTGEQLLGRTVRALRQPGRTLRTGQRLAGSTRRVLAPVLGERSPLLAGRSTTRRLDALELPLDALREAARRTGVSVNDAYTTAVLGAVRRYHDHHGVHIDTLPIAIPVDTRDDREGKSVGNHLTVARFAAPAGEPDPVLRMRMVNELTTAARAEHAAAAPRYLAELLAPLPTGIVTPVLRGLATANDAQITSFRTFDRPVHLAGARVLRMYPFGPLMAAALSATMISFDGQCCVGLNLDPAAVREPELFTRCLDEAFEEVVTREPVARP